MGPDARQRRPVGRCAVRGCVMRGCVMRGCVMRGCMISNCVVIFGVWCGVVWLCDTVWCGVMREWGDERVC